jgi:two-component system, NarL family, response regulator
MIRVLLVEDDEVFRLGLTASLKNQSHIELVGICTDGKTAIESAETLQPDIILMDIGLPVVSGIQATKSIKSRSPDTKILILTSHSEPKTVEQMMQAGADGFCLKGISTERLHTLIQDVYEGAYWIDPAVAAQVKTYLQTAKSQMNDQPLPADFPKEAIQTLTEREREVLALIADGKKNQDIADILVISPGTVRVHVHSILSKLNVKDRTQAAIFLMRKHSGESDI